MFIGNSGGATTTGFDDLELDEITYGFAATYIPEFGDLPGNY